MWAAKGERANDGNKFDWSDGCTNQAGIHQPPLKALARHGGR